MGRTGGRHVRSITKKGLSIAVVIAMLSTFVGPLGAFASDGTFVRKWGQFGTGQGEFSTPYGIAVGPTGDVYVADTGNSRIQQFTSNGGFVREWGKAGGGTGTGDGEFDSPNGIAVAPSGTVYVLDTNNQRIQRFAADGTYLGQWGSSGQGDGQFWYGTNITVDSTGDVWVADTWNHRVQKFDATGTFLGKIGRVDCTAGTADGEFNQPIGLTTDSSNNVYVVDRGNDRIQKFSSAGAYLGQFGGVHGTGDGEMWGPWGLASDAAGDLYVSDYGNNRVQKFTSSGVFITKWYGGPGSSFDCPTDIECDASGNVYTVEWAVSRVQKFGNALPPVVITAAYGGFDSTNIGSYQINGSAQLFGSAIRLTPSDGGQSGSVFWKQKVALEDDGSFVSQFAFQISDPQGGGADGFTFCVQPGTNTAVAEGGGLGYAGLPDSLAVEFDTWQNGEFSDPDDNHIGVDLDGSVNSVVTAPAPFTLESGTVGYAWIEYDGTNHALHVRVSDTNVRPATALIDYDVDLLAHYGPDVFLGFTAATGGASANHDILGWYFDNKYSADGLDPATIPYVMGPASIEAVAAPASLSGGETSDVTFTVKDRDGALMVGQALTVTAPLGGAVSAGSVTTDANGQVAVVYTAPPGRQLRTVRASAAGGLFGEAGIVVDDAVPVVDPQAGVTTAVAHDWTVVAPDLTVTDADDATLAKALIRILDPESGEELSETNFPLTVDYHGSSITIDQVGTVADYQSALRGITYRGAPTATTRQVEFSVFDGLVWSTPVVKTIEVVPPPPFFSRVLDTIRVSVDENGDEGAKGSRTPAISADGEHVAFYSGNALVPGDENGQRDWYVRDLDTGSIELVSVATDGTLADASLGYYDGTCDISGDGRYVVFDSNSDVLDSSDGNGRRDVFLRDRQEGTTVRVSENADGSDGFAGEGTRYGSRSGVISRDGRYVVFYTGNQFLAEDTNGQKDWYRKDMVTGEFELVSVATDGTLSNSGGSDDNDRAAISADGRYVAFDSWASNLVEGDENGKRDVFLRDMVEGTTVLVSADPDGAQRDDGDGSWRGSRTPAISADGRFVVFASGNQYVEKDTNWGAVDWYRKDMTDGSIELASANRDGVAGDRGPGGNDGTAAISDDGRYVAFISSATDLVSSDFNGQYDVFVRDMRAGRTSIVTGWGETLSDGWTGRCGMSADGSVVAYESWASNLLESDTNGASDVFVAWLRPANSAPVASDVSAVAQEDETLVVAAPGLLSSVADADGDALTAESVDGASHGSVTVMEDGSWTYEPEGDWNGTDTFTYRAYDGTEYSNTATVTITVAAVNDVPVAVDDTVTVMQGGMLVVPAPGVLANDTDVEGAQLAAFKVTDPAHGSLIALDTNGSLTYVPDPDFYGTDTFTYRAGDGDAYSAPATVTLTVTPKPYSGVRVARPWTRWTVRRGSRAVVYGYLSKYFKTGTYPVTLYCYHMEQGAWVLRKTVALKATSYNRSRRTTKYAGRIVFPLKGRWRIVAVHADPRFQRDISAPRYFRVR